MNELKQYVDSLFFHQRLTPSVVDLKEEILSNMIAKKNDLVTQGLSDEEAIQKAKESLLSIEGLIEGNQLTYIQKYYSDSFQSAFLWSIVAWIFSIPLMILGAFAVSTFTMLIMVALGISYLVKSKSKNEMVAFISVDKSNKRTKLAWIIWIVFIVVTIFAVTAVSFASNIWFHRPIHISGPYEFATIAMRYYIPLLTIFIPIAIGGFTKALIKNEKRS